MKFEEFKEKFDAYMATPESQIHIDNMVKRMEDKQIEYRNNNKIPLGFTYAQEDALEALRDLHEEYADEVIKFFQKEREERKHKKELEKEIEKDIYGSRD
jgi:hypothetical protein